MSNNSSFIPYGRQSIDQDDIQAVVEALKSDWLTQGPKIEEFEGKIAEYCGSKFSVVFNSGTAALHASYFALGLNHGDEFITTPNTFVATSNAGIYLGARPVFSDVEYETGNIDVSKIEAAITKKTKLIVPVHYAGHPVDMFKVHQVAKKHNLFVVEDACHAIGSKYRAKNSKNWIKVGSCRHSDMTAFSFHPVKHITTGEGGAVTTNNKGYYEKLLAFRTHGITKQHFINEPDGDWYYEMQFLGYNYRMTDMQAALGISQLEKLEGFVERRLEIAGMYSSFFEGNEYFDFPVDRKDSSCSYHLYPLRLKGRYKRLKKQIALSLKQNGIGSQVHYIPVYSHPFYINNGYRKGQCPVAEDFYQAELSIPMYPAMKNRDVKHVADSLKEVFRKL